jgi:hypothetical protein
MQNADRVGDFAVKMPTELAILQLTLSEVR